jgi:hypothetical protein
MDDNANKITALAARGDLAAARLAMARFVSIWGE